MIDKNTKITIGVLIGILALLIPATIGFSQYIDYHVDTRIKPIQKSLDEIHKDIREIRSYLMGEK